MSRPGSQSGARGGRESWTFAALAIVLAAVFGRLGVWQIDRLGERRDANRIVQARMELPPADLTATLAAESLDDLAWRRLRVTGTWDLDHEIVVRARAQRGSPGVHVVTPLVYRPDSAVLVLRGWLPAADGVSVDLDSARPTGATSEVALEGLALASEAPSQIPPRRRSFDGLERLVIGALAVDQATESVPHDLLPFYILSATSGSAPGSPVLVQEPQLSDGPHLLYAIQWFAFALISLVGALVYIRSRRRSGSLEGDGT